MKITLSVVKVDISSIGGHITPSEVVLSKVESYLFEKGHEMLRDYHVAHTGDDIALLIVPRDGRG